MRRLAALLLVAYFALGAVMTGGIVTGGSSRNSSLLDFSITLASHNSGDWVAPKGLKFEAYSTATYNGVALNKSTCASGTCDKEMQCIWNSGDSADNANRTTGSMDGARAMNVDGPMPIVSFLYPNPGTFTVTASCHINNEWAHRTLDVTIDDPDVTYATTETVCLSGDASGGDFTGCPAGATQTDQTTFSSSDLVQGQRVLLRATKTFTVSSVLTPSNCALDGDGEPIYVGRYGTGANPITNHTYTGNGFDLSDCQGVRWVEVDMTNAATAADEVAFDQGVATTTSFATDTHIVGSTVTGWRLNVHSPGANAGNTLGGYHKGITIARNTFSHGPTGDGGDVSFFLYVDRMIVLDNDLGDQTGEHVLRSHFPFLATIAHNDIGTAANGRVSVTLRASNWNYICGGNGDETNDLTAFGVPTNGLDNCADDNANPSAHHWQVAFNEFEGSSSGTHTLLNIEAQSPAYNESLAMGWVVGNFFKRTASSTVGSHRRAIIAESVLDTLYQYNVFNHPYDGTVTGDRELIHQQGPGTQEQPTGVRNMVLGNVMMNNINATGATTTRIVTTTNASNLLDLVGNVSYALDTDTNNTHANSGHSATGEESGNLLEETTCPVGACPSTATSAFTDMPMTAAADDGMTVQHMPMLITADLLCRDTADANWDAGPLDGDAIACPSS